jgi:sugar lactone lactonase YvrE
VTFRGGSRAVASLVVLCAAIGAGAGQSRDAAPEFVLAWGRKGSGPGEFHSPIGLAITRDDEVWVTDLNNARVQLFSSEGQWRGGFDLPWDAPPRRSTMIGGIALDGEGLVYLSFMVQHRIGVYTPDGRLVRQWGKKGAAAGEFNQPGGMVFDAKGNLFVADQCNHRVQQFSREGGFLGQWGGHGKEPGKFDGVLPPGSRFGGPHFLSIDARGRFYTTEGTHGRIQQLAADGQPLAAWGDKSAEPGGFGGLKTGFSAGSFGPIGVLADRQGRVWVSSLNDRVQAFSPEGKFLFGLGLAGTGDQPGRFARPHGLAVDSRGHLYVADAGNQRIQKFRLPR